MSSSDDPADAARMPKTVRMVATDLDGTLLRADGSVSPRTAAAVAGLGQVDIELVLVTARPPRWVHVVVDQLPHSHPLAICSNGALVYDVAARRVVREHAITPETAAEVVARLRRELPSVVFAVEVGLRYGQEPNYLNQWPVPPDALIEEVEALVAEPVAKLIARHPEAVEDHWALVETARRAVGGLVEVTSSGVGAPIELAAPGVSKAFALEILAAGHDLGPGDVVAFGDMPNDLPMLAWAGYSVAPANAHPDVLAIVDEVTGHHDEDGVAAVLERLVRPAPAATRSE